MPLQRIPPQLCRSLVRTARSKPPNGQSPVSYRKDPLPREMHPKGVRATGLEDLRSGNGRS